MVVPTTRGLTSKPARISSPNCDRPLSCSSAAPRLPTPNKKALRILVKPRLSSGKFIKISVENIQQLHFRLDLNGKTVQQGSTAEMLFGVDRIIAYASRFFTLKTGDLFFTGTPCGVGPVHKEDHLEAWLEGEKMLHLRVK
jgi:hypothetical protein